MISKTLGIAFAVFAAAAVSACDGSGVIALRGELHSDSPGFQPVVRDDGSPEPPSGDVSEDPSDDEGTTGGDAGGDGQGTTGGTAGNTSGGTTGDDGGTTGTTGDGGTAGTTGGEPEGPQEAELPSGADAFADRVVSKTIGDGGGFHESSLPGVVLGAPHGGGLFQGGTDVFSLGVGGEIVLEMTDYVIFDGDGPDFTVFENAFQVGSDPQNTFAEPGIVGVSEDGETFFDFPCNLSGKPYEGCAGIKPAIANSDVNALDPRDPAVSGGDVFDLGDVGLKTARFVRIRDSELGLGPIGPGTRGFDLDAVAIIHGTLP
ncbi:MAG TPA: hypothetical protein VFX30_03845 [bacterium]|nr:hypothetical protein [bacterium]